MIFPLSFPPSDSVYHDKWAVDHKLSSIVIDVDGLFTAASIVILLVFAL